MSTKDFSRRIVALLLALGLCFAAGCATKFNPAGGGGSGATQANTGGSVWTVTGGAGAGGAGAGGAGVGGAGGTGASTAGAGGAGGVVAGDGGIIEGGAGTGTGGTSGTGGIVPTGGSGGSAGSDAQVEPPQTCPATSEITPGETTQQIQVGNLTRSFILYVPSSYTGQTQVPLVLDWHGILMSGSMQRMFSGWAGLADSQGFIVAYPNGIGSSFNCSNICCDSDRTIDDVGFAKAIVAALSQKGCIDKKRVHSVGYSLGGGMSMDLACNAADVFASVAASAFDLMPEVDWPCHPSRGISVITFRSTSDPIVPYNGGDTVPPNGLVATNSSHAPYVYFLGAQATFAQWATLDGCTDQPAQGTGGCSTYSQCKDGAAVTLCVKQGGGHDYMDAPTAWTFLSSHPMP